MLFADEIQALAKVKFAEKVKMIEKATGRDLETYFIVQVGPEDAKTIMNQMEAMFVSGFCEGMKFPA